MRKLTVSIIIIFFFVQGIFAAKVFKDQKRVAITSFKANNLKEHYATIARNMLETELYKTGSFIVLERDQIELVARENKIASYGKDDTKTAVEIGEVVSADFALICSIDYLEKYYITVKAVRVKEGDVYTIVTEDFDDINDLRPKIQLVAKKIRQDLKKSSLVSGQWTVQPSLGVLSAFGNFDALINPGLLLQCKINYENLFVSNLITGVTVSWISARGKKNYIHEYDMNVDGMYFVPVYFNLGYYINVSERLRFAPIISAGYAYCLNRVNTTEEESEEKIQYYQAYTARFEFDILLFKGVGLVVDTGWSGFFRNEKPYHAVIMSIGLGMYF